MIIVHITFFLGLLILLFCIPHFVKNYTVEIFNNNEPVNILLLIGVVLISYYLFYKIASLVNNNQNEIKKINISFYEKLSIITNLISTLLMSSLIIYILLIMKRTSDLVGTVVNTAIIKIKKTLTFIDKTKILDELERTCNLGSESWLNVKSNLNLELYSSKSEIITAVKNKLYILKNNTNENILNIYKDFGYHNEPVTHYLITHPIKVTSIFLGVIGCALIIYNIRNIGSFLTSFLEQDGKIGDLLSQGYKQSTNIIEANYKALQFFKNYILESGKINNVLCEMQRAIASSKDVDTQLIKSINILYQKYAAMGDVCDTQMQLVENLKDLTQIVSAYIAQNPPPVI